jgi:hypothetical protein
MTTAHHSMLKWPWMQYVSWLQVQLLTFANHVISSFFASMNCQRPSLQCQQKVSQMLEISPAIMFSLVLQIGHACNLSLLP